MNIPKKMAHIWIGPLSPPTEWMNTWKEKHSNWEYTLYDNDFLKKFKFKNQKLIDRYSELNIYAGIADIMRYEILYKYGGYIAAADSICYHNIEELLDKEQAYTVYENELIRGKLVSPIMACEPQNKFVGQLIDELSLIDPDDLDWPWISTGNLFVANMIEKYKPKITIFPSHYFIPVHFEGIVYAGSDKIYAKQLFGSTQESYAKSKKSLFQKIAQRSERKRQKEMFKDFNNRRSTSLMEKFKTDFS